jgi:UDPglucose 6-dehydrogenase
VTSIYQTVVAVNDQRKRAMARKVTAALGGSIRGKTIALLGLTFKPNTDDMREAPSLYIVQALQDAGAKIKAYDPVGMDGAREILNGVDFVSTPYEAAEGSHALAIITEWEVFRALDLKRLKSVMKEPAIVDFRNIYPAT